MKHKVSELTGGLLDAAVVAARRTEGPDIRHQFSTHRVYGDACRAYPGGAAYSPSTDWSQGGPIIEREGIAIAPYEHGIGEPSMWVAWVEERQHQATFDSYFERGIFDDNSRGHTPLIAAMRAYVCSKLGEEVELP